jgi:FdrA protein
MITKGFVKKGAYFDSVTLMMVSKELRAIPGVIDSAVIMGSAENRAILKAAGLFSPEFEKADESDLLIAINAEDEAAGIAALNAVDGLLKKIRTQKTQDATYAPKSLKSALTQLPNANLALISVAGKYAAEEARKALDQNLHVMIFSDNVPLAEEIELKKKASKKGLFVMGPDCGTAIINGVPLAFANVVKRGNVGIVAAAGTGLQEVSSILFNAGAGISQAIGTGGRDVKKEVGGIMFLQALEALQQDRDTQIIVLISKPPHPEVLKKIAAQIKKSEKPVIAAFLGTDPNIVKDSGAMYAEDLEYAALMAAALSQGQSPNAFQAELQQRNVCFEELAQAEAGKKQKSQKYVRGLFSGGTLCAEAQVILRRAIGDIYSNVPLIPELKLPNSFKSMKHSVVDFGEDEFTVGRPHPMIDFSLRNHKMIEEAQDPEVAVILFDVVLGYGAHPDPAAELAPTIRQIRNISPQLSIICSITGTEQDPQNKSHIQKSLQEAGVLVLPSNAAACELTAKILGKLAR